MAEGTVGPPPSASGMMGSARSLPSVMLCKRRSAFTWSRLAHWEVHGIRDHFRKRSWRVISGCLSYVLSSGADATAWVKGEIPVVGTSPASHPGLGSPPLRSIRPKHLRPTNSFSYNMELFRHRINETERQRIMRVVRKIRDPMQRAEATFNLQLFDDDIPGFVYTNYRANHQILEGLATAPADEEVDWVDLKSGRTNDIERRRGEYTRDCKGEEIAWGYCYPTNRPKLLEALIHLNVRARLAKREPYPCHGCGKRHCEHSSWERIGGLEGMAEIIEYWLGRLEEPIERRPLYNPL
ncbi:hypothetical protein DFH07DRAFT_960661 [Mycena maculata]|uniref:Uncharacterized protein n=1 Tax=Mycena maculata TaxID=230809 RepID=A0AAD7IYW0_9AGAR|nr:hypothetical protein DFH07DRAFT_960661 [Mycena maculata]